MARKNVNKAIMRLADLRRYGHLQAETDPAGFLAGVADRLIELTEALRPFASAFERHKYGEGVSARDWKRAFDVLNGDKPWPD